MRHLFSFAAIWLVAAVVVMFAHPAAVRAEHSAEEAANAAAFRSFEKAYNDQAERWFEDYHNEDYVWEGYGVWAPQGRHLAYQEMLPAEGGCSSTGTA